MLLFTAPAFGLDTSKLKPTGYVNDFAHVLDPAGTAKLEAYCGAVERATGAQFAIVLVDSLEDDPIENVANTLYREWGIGKKGTDEGLLLLLAVKDRKQRAEVGYGLEPLITDGFSGGVLRSIRPILRQGDYADALYAAVQQFGARIAEAKGVTIEGQPRTVRRTSRNGGGPGFGTLIFGVIMFLLFMRMMGGGRRGGGGGGTGFLAGMLLGNLLGGGRRGGGWDGGGGFGGYDGGGGGGGGFGGFGGGDSGGGGASSDW